MISRNSTVQRSFVITWIKWVYAFCSYYRLFKDDNIYPLSLHLHSTQSPSHQCSVEDLAVDDVSLPALIQLGLHTLCSRVTNVRLDFSKVAESETIHLLSTFSSISALVLVAFRYVYTGRIWMLVTMLKWNWYCSKHHFVSSADGNYGKCRSYSVRLPHGFTAIHRNRIWEELYMV